MLDPNDRHYERIKSDLNDSLYKMYDKIENIETQVIDAKARKQAIEENKITSDNIYKTLLSFEKLYDVISDEEKRQLVQELIDEINIYEERQPNGQWLKAIKFRLPIIDKDLELSLDNDEHIETVCQRHDM